MLPEQGYDRLYSWSAIIFVFARGMEPEILAHVFLVDSQPNIAGAGAVVPFHDNRNLFSEAQNTGVGNDETSARAS